MLQENTLKKHVHNDLTDFRLFENYEAVKIPACYELETKEGLPSNIFKDIPDSRALINKHTGRLMSDKTVTASYTLENHVNLYDKHAQLIKKTNLPWGNVEITDEITENGLKARRSIKYLDTEKFVNGNDPIFCRSDVINSVNMTWAFQMFGGAYRSYCENSMVFGGDRIAYSKSKHTKHFNSSALLTTASSLLENYEQNFEKFNLWKNTPIKTPEALLFLADQFCQYTKAEQEKRALKALKSLKFPRSSETLKELELSEEIKYNVALLGVMQVLWDRYEKEQGDNLWALLNVMTHYATHTHSQYLIEKTNKIGDKREAFHETGRKSKNVMISGDNRAYTLDAQQQRSKDVCLVLLTPAWKQLEQGRVAL